MSGDASLNAASVIGLALIVGVHLAVPRFRFLDDSGSTWLDVLAGVALGYVFVDILPHLAGFQAKLLPLADAGAFGFLEHHSYLMAMAGVLFYLAISLSTEQARSNERGTETSFSQLPIATQAGAFSLAAYAFLVGYLLSERLTHGAGSTVGLRIGLSGCVLEGRPRMGVMSSRYGPPQRAALDGVPGVRVGGLFVSSRLPSMGLERQAPLDPDADRTP